MTFDTKPEKDPWRLGVLAANPIPVGVLALERRGKLGG
jgi:hypothetical protein